MSSTMFKGSLVFIVLGILAYVLSIFKINRKFNQKEQQDYFKGIAQGMCLMATFFTWSHWICCYMHQMHPLLQPIPESH